MEKVQGKLEKVRELIYQNYIGTLYISHTICIPYLKKNWPIKAELYFYIQEFS